MNNRDLATTLTKLGGFALVIYAVITAASFTSILISNPDWESASYVVTMYGANVLLAALIGFILIRFGGILIGRHFPDTEVRQENLESFETSALSVMGVLLFYYAASDMIVHMAQLYQANQMINSGIYTEFTSSVFAVVVATLFEIGFSLWLIFGSAGIVNLIKRFRGR